MAVRDRVRRHTLGVSTVLSVVSLALVFAAALRVVPAEAIPRAPDGVVAAIPHANAVITATAFVAVVVGWRWARRGDLRKHRTAMLTAFSLFLVFLALYLYKVALEGPTSYDGTGALRTAYLALLGIHVTLAVVCVPLVYYVLVLALTRPMDEIPLTRHPTVGRVAALLWLVSFGLGLVVYGILYL